MIRVIRNFTSILVVMNFIQVASVQAGTPGSGVSVGVPVALVGFVGAGFAVYQMTGGQAMSLTQFTNAAAQAGKDAVAAGGAYSDGLTNFILERSAGALGVSSVQFKAFLEGYQSPELTASSSLQDRLEQVVLDAKNAAYKVPNATLAQQEALSKEFLQNQVSRFSGSAGLPPEMGNGSDMTGGDDTISPAQLEELVATAKQQELGKLQAIEEADTSDDQFLNSIKLELQDATDALNSVIQAGGEVGDEAYELANARVSTVEDYIRSNPELSGSIPIVD